MPPEAGNKGCNSLCCAAGGALSPNGVLSPRAQARHEFQGSSQPAEDLRYEHEHQPELVSANISSGEPAEGELPPMTPAEAQVQMTLLDHA